MAEPRSLDPARHSRLLCALAGEAQAHPLARKILVCRRHGEGLELLRALAAAGASWIGFEATTPKRLALDVLGADDHVGGALLDEFDEQALIDAAIDDVLQQRGAASRYASLAEGTGLRRALAQAVQALRLGGIDARAVRRYLAEPARQDAIGAILARYDELRRVPGRLDAADLFARANTALRADSHALAHARILIVPGHSLRGESGALLDTLVEQGATVLPEDDIAGLARPVASLHAADAGAADGRGRAGDGHGSADGEAAGSTRLNPFAYLHDVAAAPAPAQGLSLFAATSLQAELREVLRRVVAAGVRWDEAEIAATDPAAYAVALDGLARRLDVPVGYATGLPVSRTRPGRVVAAYLRWIEDDFREDVIRGLIERSEIAPPGARVPSGPTLARRLRRLRIGRGRARYLDTIRRALRALDHPVDDDDDTSREEHALYRERERTQLRALESMLQPILAATPELGDARAPAQRRASAAALARGVRAALELAPAEAEIDRAAKDRLVERLERIESTLTRMTTLRGALATLTEKLDERVPAPEAGGRAPWVSSGGRLHFTDIDGAGQSGRRLTFIVGLDAGRFPDVSASDALLSDSDRRRLGAVRSVPPLPTSAERIDERRYAFAAALARMRGKVTLSYAAWSAAEGRTVAPSSELLQAFRLQTGNADADYDALQRALAPYASAVPRTVAQEPAARGVTRRKPAAQPAPVRAPAAQLDASDVWLGALDDHGLLRRGDTVVAAAYPALGRGLAAVTARAGNVPTAFHGVVHPRPSFDPRNRDVPMSASRLQMLGACPHRYLLQVVLGVRPPRDPDDDPARWLNALDRGAALHEVFEQTLREARSRGLTADGEPGQEGAGTLHEIAASQLDAVLARLEAEQPPPGQAVRDRERRALHSDVRAFVRMLVDEPREWIALEAAFGEDDAPVTLDLAGGRLRIRGKIDRIDRTAENALVVVDYKTGSIFPFRRETGTYAGGRRLQHAFYAAGAEALHEGVVRRIEYQFPGERGRNESAVYERTDIDDAPRLLDHLLDMAAHGWFVPTEDAKEDCRYCDVRAVCRVRLLPPDKVDSPLAEWSAQLLDSDADALRALRALRGW